VIEIQNQEYLIHQVDQIKSAFEKSTDSAMLIRIEKLAREIFQIFLRGNRIAFVGNGGSAAEAMHLAAEFTGKCLIDHPPLAAVCLNESQSALTAIANDFGIEQMFARSVRAMLGPGDLLIALSTSGNSQNILTAIDEAEKLGVKVILWSGENCAEKAFEVWRASSGSTPRIQEVHLVWGHLLAEIVERNWL
jgi:D-sedoheptulose 7-phosphate isomerase